MENPAGWTDAEKVINKAYAAYWELHREGHYGVSVVRFIADALREHDMLKEKRDEPDNA